MNLLAASGDGSASVVTLAIVSALSGIAGALAGGYATYKIEQVKQDFESRREAERESALTRGSARAMRADFANSELSLSSSLRSAVWWPKAVTIWTPSSIEDRKRVASASTADEWDKVALAGMILHDVVAARNFHPDLTSENRLPPLSDDAKELFEKASHATVEAQAALNRLAET